MGFLTFTTKLLVFAGLATAICPGYNFGFINAGISAAGNHIWWTMDDSCDGVDACYLSNPCSCPNLGCSPSPVHVDHVRVNGLWYYCRADPNSGDCKGWHIESCCRNDGRRNLGEGLINERQFAAIEETNAMLDKQKREYEGALERGLNESDIEMMTAVHKRELREAEKKEKAPSSTK